MKLLFYINTLQSGGAERVMINLCNQFKEHGYDVMMINSFKSSWEYNTLNKKIPHIYLEEQTPKNKILKNIHRIKELRKIIKKEAPDAVISFMTEPNIRNILASIGQKNKTIISVRNNPESIYQGKINQILVRFLYCLANVCVFQNETAKQYFPKRVQRKSLIIANQIDKSFFEDFIRKEDNNIVSVGRLVKQKNQKLLIKAFDLIKDKTNLNVKIFGDGDEKKELQQLVQDLALEDRVFFMGNVHDIKDSIKNSKIYIMTSEYEGMPNSLIEAMTLGIPVISTNFKGGGAKELINNGENGFLTSYSEEEIATKILELDNSEMLREKFRMNAKKKVEVFKPENIFKDWEKVLTKYERI